MFSTRNLVSSALFTALIIAGTFVRVPIGPVPIVLANLFVLLAGFFLPVQLALLSVGLYLLLGILGLPIFAAGGGLAYFLGPTGGFLIGYLPSAALVALLASRTRYRLWRDIAAALAGIVILYALGVPWLKVSLAMTWPKAIAAGMLPFLPGDALKGAAAVGVVFAIRRRYAEIVPRLATRPGKTDGIAP